MIEIGERNYRSVSASSVFVILVLLRFFYFLSWKIFREKFVVERNEKVWETLGEVKRVKRDYIGESKWINRNKFFLSERTTQILTNINKLYCKNSNYKLNYQKWIIYWKEITRNKGAKVIESQTMFSFFKKNYFVIKTVILFYLYVWKPNYNHKMLLYCNREFLLIGGQLINNNSDTWH